jgi:plasmid maintenance system antidote protein VapI
MFKDLSSVKVPKGFLSRIARLINVSPSTVSRWCRGDRSISLENAVTLSLYLGIPKTYWILLSPDKLLATMYLAYRETLSEMDAELLEPFDFGQVHAMKKC